MFVCRQCGHLEAREGYCSRDGSRLEPREDGLVGTAVGSYRLTRLVGKGGMGFVYQGVQPSIGSRVAVKVLGGDAVADGELVSRFFDEARAVNLIRHENIVNVLDLAHLPDGRPYIVMEFLDGQTLRSALASQRLPFAAAMNVVGEVLDALGAAHRQGVVHRDLKPENIFVTPGGHAKVLDFGIAKLRPNLTGDKPATRTGVVMGTPHYMSPEQALGGRLDARTDLYSLGIILFETVTGTRPFEAPSMYGLIQQHVGEPPPAPGSRRAGVPPELERVVLLALEKDPNRRFPSAAAMKEALFSAYASSGMNAAPLGPAACPTVPLASGAAERRAAAGSYGAPPSPHGGEASYGLGTQAGLTPAPAPTEFHFTAPAAAATFGSGTVAAAYTPANAGTYQPMSPARNGGAGGWPVLLLVGCGGLGVLTAVAGVGVYLWLAMDTDRDQVQVTPAGSTTTVPGTPSQGLADLIAQAQQQGGSVVLGGGLRDPSLADETPDLRAFDPAAFVPRALELARNHHPDAQLTSINVDGLRPSGLVDLTANDDFDVFYSFRSPSRSVPPPSHPTNLEYEGPCVASVYVDEDGVRSFPGTWECDAAFVPLPRCTPKQLWAKAAASGAPSGNVIGTFRYAWDENSKAPRWHLSIPPSFSESFPDGC